jgi:hypothetical protein
VPLVFTKADHSIAPTAPILHDNPCVHLSVRVRWVAFVPAAGARTQGTVSLQSPEHVGLLLLDYFNVSIPAAQLGTAYRWDAGQRCWVSRTTGMALAAGDPVPFEILGFASEAGVLMITGSVDRLAERRAEGRATSKKAVQPAGWQVAAVDAPGGPASETGDRPRKKSKKEKRALDAAGAPSVKKRKKARPAAGAS